MDILQFEIDTNTGITSVFAHPQVATIFAAGAVVGGVGVAGALMLKNLVNVLLGDPLKLVEGMKAWLRDIKTVLDAVIDRVKRHIPHEEERKVWIAYLKNVQHPEDVMTQYDVTWGSVIKLQSESKKALRLSYFERRRKIKALQEPLQNALQLCETLDIRVTTYSNTLNEYICPEDSEEYSEIAQSILKLDVD